MSGTTADAALLALAAMIDQPEALDRAERDLDRLGIGGGDEPWPDRFREIQSRLDEACLRTSEDVARALAILRDEAAPGRVADPRLAGAELPWLLLVTRLAPTPERALLVARSWYAHLVAVSSDLADGLWAPCAPQVIASNAAAILALRSARPCEAARWLAVAEIEALVEEGCVTTRAFIRAMRACASR